MFVCRSSSSSDSEDGGADVIGVGGGSDSEGEEGEEGVKGSPSGGVKSPSTSQGEGWSPFQCHSPM